MYSSGPKKIKPSHELHLQKEGEYLCYLLAKDFIKAIAKMNILQNFKKKQYKIIITIPIIARIQSYTDIIY